MDPEQLKREYRDKRRPLYEVLCPRIATLIDELIRDVGIPIVQIESRTKTVESFINKIEQKSYKQPFTEIKDFAGIRVVCYYNDDVLRIAQLLGEDFDVDEEHSVDKVQSLAVDEFGYRSFHLVGTIKDPRASLPEWKALASLSFEVQIRSVLQHAWAAISHKLDYKTASQAPRDIRRQLFQLSALLELTDDQFASIRRRSAEISADYRLDVDKGDLSIPLDLDSLSEYVREKADLDQWEQFGVNAGLNSAGHRGDKQQDKKDLQTLFMMLQGIGVTDLGELDEMIHKHSRSVPQILKKVAATSEKHGFLMNADPIDVLTVSLAVAERERFPDDYEWPKPWRSELRMTMEELLAPKRNVSSTSRRRGTKT